MASAWQVDVWQYAQDYAPTVEALGGAASAMLFSHTVPMLALLFGAVLGLLLPRPKWLSGSRSSAVLVTALPGLRSFALSVQALFIIREVWTHFTYPGTFRGLVQSTAAWCTGRGWTFSWPTSFATNSTAAPAAKAVDTIVQAEPQEQTDNWYVGEKDVAFFRYHAIDNGVEPGATPWEIMMDKNIPNFLRYTAWRRTLPSGKTEYKSTTIAPDVTAEEFMDMYLDDAFRHNWDGMVIHHEVLEHGDFSKRDLVVRWIRRFPFAFLSDREYTIARRCFREPDGSLIAITKALAGHPREATDSNVVKMDVFWSMWRSVNVACPWGSGKPATETTLLHHEQFKIPENLARFAVRHGMWGFLRTLGQQVPLYVAERRKRLGAHERDMAAYGSGHAPNPPLLSRASSAGASSASLSSMASSALSSSSSDGSDGSWTGSSEDGDASNGYRPRKRRGGIKGLAALALAGGLAVLLGAKGVDSRATTRHSRREPGRSDAKRRRRAERAARHAAIREE